MEAAIVDPLDLSTCNSQPSGSNLIANSAARCKSQDGPAAPSHHHHQEFPPGFFITSDCDKVEQPISNFDGNHPAEQGPAAAGASADEAHRCDICGKTFAVPARLTRHYRTHTGRRLSLFKYV